MLTLIDVLESPGVVMLVCVVVAATGLIFAWSSWLTAQQQLCATGERSSAKFSWFSTLAHVITNLSDASLPRRSRWWLFGMYVCMYLKYITEIRTCRLYLLVVFCLFTTCLLTSITDHAFRESPMLFSASIGELSHHSYSSEPNDVQRLQKYALLGLGHHWL